MRIRAKIARARDEDLDAGVAVWRPRDVSIPTLLFNVPIS